MTKPYYEDDLEGDEGVETSGLGRVVTVGRVVTKSQLGKDLA